jgi:hypothetical protein
VAVLSAVALIALSHPDRVVAGVELVDPESLGRVRFLVFYRSLPLLLVFLTVFYLACYAKTLKDDQYPA